MNFGDRITHLLVLIEMLQLKQLIGRKSDDHFIVVHSKGFLELVISDKVWIVFGCKSLQLIFQLNFGCIVTHDACECQDGNEEQGALF